jgi:hypothetical protein
MDSRIGRWLAMDPLTAKFPAWSPYVSMNNNPIRLIDPNGKEVKLDLNRCGDFKTKEEREKFHFKVLNDLQSLTNDKVEFHEDKPGSNIFTLKIVEKGTANGGSPLNTGTKLIEDLVRAEKTVTIVDGAPLANETGSRNRTSTCPANEALVLNKQPVSCTVRYTGLRGAVAEGGNRSGVPDGTPDLPDGAVGGLGHELFHAEDLLYGKVASHQAWVEDFDVPAGSSVRMRNMSEAERSVRARENKLRAEQKMPLRVMPRLIEAPHPEPPRQRGPFLGDDCLYIK